MAFVVDNGKGPNESLLPPPSDLPKCWGKYQLTFNVIWREQHILMEGLNKANDKIFLEYGKNKMSNFLIKKNVQLTFIGKF
jgi:hypothetical protein